MSNEVEFVLEQLGSVVGSTTTPLRRVNRDDSRILEQDVRSIQGELQDANYVGVSYASRSTSPVGAEYDHEVETTVNVRVTGLHCSEYGWVDSSGQEGIAFEELVSRTQEALLAERTWPAAGSESVSYTHLEIADYNPGMSAYADYYQYDYDVTFHGFEEL